MRFEWLVLGAFVLALLADHFVVWRAFVRTVAHDPAQARRRWWGRTAALLWGCAALVLALWAVRGGPPGVFGLPQGWRLWGPLAATAIVVGMQAMGAMRIARMTGDRSPLRARLGSTGQVMPHHASELPAWLGMSLTAGFCEELLFRGFLVWLLQPLVGAWAAAAAALAVFAAAHAYQGREGVLRSAIMGAVMTAVVFVSQSLWPAIVLHAALDAMGGWIGWLIVRESGSGASAAGSRADAPRVGPSAEWS